MTRETSPDKKSPKATHAGTAQPQAAVAENPAAAAEPEARRPSKFDLVQHALVSGELDDHELSKVMLHASSILAFRTARPAAQLSMATARATTGAAARTAATGYCFMATADTKAGDKVDIVFNGDTVGQTTYAVAIKQYPAC